MTIEYLSLFVSWVDSFLSLQLHHLLHNSIVSYPNANMDKKFFNSWVLHIPHRLRDILWMVRAWSSVAPIFSSLIMSQASSSSQSLLKVITSYILGRAFKVAITPSIFSTSYSTTTSCSLRDPCKIWLYGLYIPDLHFLQLVS